MTDIEKRAHDLAIAYVGHGNLLDYQADTFEESCELFCADYSKAYNYFMSHSEDMTEKH